MHTEDYFAPPVSKKFQGIFLHHRVLDADSKKKASESLTGWKSVELTSEQWIEKLTFGQTIQPSAFTPKTDGTFTHSIGKLAQHLLHLCGW